VVCLVNSLLSKEKGSILPLSTPGAEGSSLCLPDNWNGRQISVPVQTGRPLICKNICRIELLSHFRLLHKYPVFTRNQVRHGSWQPRATISSVPFQLSTASPYRFSICSFSRSCHLFFFFLSMAFFSTALSRTLLLRRQTCIYHWRAKVAVHNF